MGSGVGVGLGAGVTVAVGIHVGVRVGAGVRVGVGVRACGQARLEPRGSSVSHPRPIRLLLRAPRVVPHNVHSPHGDDQVEADLVVSGK